jgi:hypothetical protein
MFSLSPNHITMPPPIAPTGKPPPIILRFIVSWCGYRHRALRARRHSISADLGMRSVNPLQLHSSSARRQDLTRRRQYPCLAQWAAPFHGQLWAPRRFGRRLRRDMMAANGLVHATT